MYIGPMMKNQMDPIYMSPGDVAHTIWQLHHQYLYLKIIYQFQKKYVN